MLAEAGCTVEPGAAGMTVTGPDALPGVDVDLHDASELTPTVAAVAALADRPVADPRGRAHPRARDRPARRARRGDQRRWVATSSRPPDGLEIRPVALHGGPWRAYADHRMATAGALLGLVVPGVEIDDVECTAKTIPDFPARWAAMLVSECERP